MLTRQATSVAALLAVWAAVPHVDAKHSVVNVFDSDFAGVDGWIVVTYDSPSYSGAKINADLRHRVKWRIHTKWFEPNSRDSSSASFDECGERITGGHYDPYKICGPGSQYADTPACAPKISEYKCTPDEYQENFAACEAGDLSGKLGTLKPDANRLVKAEWYDLRFPFLSEVTTAWPIVIEAVCGDSSLAVAGPRISCSNGRKSVSDTQTRAMVKSHRSRTSTGQRETNDDAGEVHAAVRKAHGPRGGAQRSIA